MVTKIKEKVEIQYKSYNQDQIVHLPILLKSFVKNNVLVKLIDELVERMDLELLNKYYSGIGCPPYHPKMLIKVWLYGYCNKVYTCRPLAKKLREDLGFMWLSGMQKPCFKTLSEFRGNRMTGLIDEVFREVLEYLVENDYIDLDDLYIDGSKWEANGNKFKVVWRKNTERYKLGVTERIKEILEQIKLLQQLEDEKYGASDLKEHESEGVIQIALTSESLSLEIQKVNELLAKQTDKQKKKELKKLGKKLEEETEKIKKYEKQEKVLGTRNSYSKTDEDATFMRMKDDLLRAGYNTEITTSNQYILNPTIHQNASDSPTLPSHIEKLEERVAGLVEEDWQPDVTADAGYGSEENYDLLASKSIRGFVKYPLWFQEHSGQLAKKLYRKENWPYHEAEDYFVCPAEKRFIFLETKQAITRNGYERSLRIYECESCLNCPLFQDCRGERAKPESNRRLQISRNLEANKATAKELLASDEGKDKRSQRSVDVETPFGDIKYNMGHRRFYLRGKEKVYIEFSLLSLAHNIRKIYCEKTGIWADYYAQRAAKRVEKKKKRA